MSAETRTMPDGRRIPPEVVLGYHWNQIMALNDKGQRFTQYVECSEGCGFLIGCGDAVESIAHNSCLQLTQTEATE